MSAASITTTTSARLGLMLTDLRLPTIKHLAGELCAQSDAEGWPAHRLLEALLEHEINAREARRIDRHRHESSLPGSFRLLVQRLLDHLKTIDAQVDEIESQIVKWHRQSEASRKLEQVPGIGPITASALVASIGDARNFENGRQVAAWLGLVPRQHSSGGKQNLLGISKRGDAYLRTLLIHGARSVINWKQRQPDPCSWITGVLTRRNKNVAAIALANKNARIVWALLAHDREFKADYVPAKVAT